MKTLIPSLNALVDVSLLALTALSPICSYNWLQFGGGPQHSGSNQNESIITPANVRQSKLIQLSL